MRVLHVVTTLGRGGIERWLLSMLQQIPRSTCAMDICCRGNDVGAYAATAEKLGARVFLRPLNVTQVPFVMALKQLIEAERYDVVHNHLQIYSGLPVAASRACRTTVITSFHCAGFLSDTVLRFPILRQARHLYGVASIRYALRYSDGVTGCSRGVVEYMKRVYGARRDDWRVVYYGTELPPRASEDQRIELRRRFDWPSGSKLVIHVGRFTEQKNHAGLLNIFELLLRRVPEVKLVLVGGGPLEARVRETVRTRGLTPNVAFLGYRDDVAQLLSCSDLFLFPSLLEGLGVAVLEASAAGLPVVGTKIPVLEEVVTDGVTGMLRASEDIPALAGAAAGILKNPSLAHAFGAAGRARIEAAFTNAASAAALTDTYNECHCQHWRTAAHHA